MTYLTWEQDPRDTARLIGRCNGVALYFLKELPFTGGTFQLDVQAPGFSPEGIAPFAQGGPLHVREPFDTLERAQLFAETLLGSFLMDIGVVSFEVKDLDEENSAKEEL